MDFRQSKGTGAVAAQARIYILKINSVLKKKREALQTDAAKAAEAFVN